MDRTAIAVRPPVGRDAPPKDADADVDAIATAIDRAVLVLSAIRRRTHSRRDGYRPTAARAVRDHLEREALGKSLRELGAESDPPRSRSNVQKSCQRGRAIVAEMAGRPGFSNPFEEPERRPNERNERAW